MPATQIQLLLASAFSGVLGWLQLGQDTRDTVLNYFKFLFLIPCRVANSQHKSFLQYLKYLSSTTALLTTRTVHKSLDK